MVGIKKYSYWLFVLVMVAVRKVLGSPLLPIYWLVLPFRGYARNVVYSYHLENNKVLKRLWERSPKKVSDNRWVLHNVHSSTDIGIVETRKVSSIEYWAVVFLLWGWIDDDANEDTYDKGFNSTVIQGSRFKRLPEWCKMNLVIASSNAKACPVVGNTFDLGDRRAAFPLFDACSAMLWTNRNSAYNFNYLFHEISNEELVWSAVIGGRLIGWREGTTVYGTKTWNFEIAYKVK